MSTAEVLEVETPLKVYPARGRLVTAFSNYTGALNALTDLRSRLIRFMSHSRPNFFHNAGGTLAGASGKESDNRGMEGEDETESGVCL